MKIGSITKLEPRKEKVLVGYTASREPIRMTLVEPHLGFLEEIARSIPEPRWGLGEVLKDNNGRAIRSANGARAREERRDTPQHLEAQAHRVRLISILGIVGLLEPGQVEFEAVRGKSAKEYAEAVLKELKNFGIGPAAISRLDEAALRLCVDGPEQPEVSDAEIMEPESRLLSNERPEAFVALA